MSPDSSERYRKLRLQMVSEQIEARGLSDERVLTAMRQVPRHLFVSSDQREHAYEDRALPIGPQQTISQPYIIALMLSELELKSTSKVLEVGTGSGYQAALLAELAGEVYTMEIDSELSKIAVKRLDDLGYTKAQVICGDGYAGLPAKAPFDAIIVAAAPPSIPRDLVKQLAIGGRMILPLGVEVQYLVVLEKTKDGIVSRELGGVSFVPLKPQE